MPCTGRSPSRGLGGHFPWNTQILLRLLSRKFGELSEEKRRTIESAYSESLLRWSERILSATSLDEVLQ
jgi:hypothetical protein